MTNYKVYLIRDKYRNIVYCGLTGRSLEKRFKDHKWKKQLDDTYTIELVTDYLTQEEASILERRLIAQYNLTETGLNVSPGSLNGNSQEHSAKMKAKWSIERKGKPVKPEHAAKNRAARLGHKNSKEHQQKIVEKISKPVICLETGVIYPSIRAAAKATNSQPTKVGACCKGDRYSTNNLHFEFYKKR